MLRSAIAWRAGSKALTRNNIVNSLIPSPSVEITLGGRSLSLIADSELIKPELQAEADDSGWYDHEAEDYEAELARSLRDPLEFEKTLEMPNGEIVTIGNERFRCPEVLFHPEMLGMEGPGLHESVFSTIKKSDVDIRKELANNIVLAGGTTLLPGLDVRLRKEIADLAPASMNVRVLAPEERRYTVWIGGSILASLQSFQQMLVTKNEYDETGPSIVHRKCI